MLKCDVEYAKKSSIVVADASRISATSELISSRSLVWRSRIGAKSAPIARAASISMASSWCSSSSLAHYRDQPTDGTLALNRYGPPKATWPVDSGDSKVHGVRRRIAVADPETAGNVRRTPR